MARKSKLGPSLVQLPSGRCRWYRRYQPVGNQGPSLLWSFRSNESSCQTCKTKSDHAVCTFHASLSNIWAVQRIEHSYTCKAERLASYGAFENWHSHACICIDKNKNTSCRTRCEKVASLDPILIEHCDNRRSLASFATQTWFAAYHSVSISTSWASFCVSPLSCS